MLAFLLGCVDADVDSALPVVPTEGSPEVCDGVDNDLDGEIDEHAFGGTIVHADADGDGYGDPALPDYQCSPTAGWVEDATDCDDARAASHPYADELCNTVDDDCDGAIDEADAVDAPTAYTDTDGDGYGDPDTAVRSCAPGLADGTDCHDADATVHPGAAEACTDTVDRNCDGAVAYADTDGDGSPACEDCDDLDGARYPGAVEVCDGARDEDCDGLVDDADSDVSGQSAWYADADGDGAGDGGSALLACSQPGGFVASAGDCDDTSAFRVPTATEVCDSADTDEDCDGVADDGDTSATGQTAWHMDADADGVGGDTTTSACDAPAGHVAIGGDCDDDDASLFVGCGVVISPDTGADTGDTARDTGRVDTARDTGRVDTGRVDTGRLDTARVDTARVDTARDTGRLDTGRLDTARDTSRVDTGRVDTGASADTSRRDSSTADTSIPPDTGRSDTAVADSAPPPADTAAGDSARTADTAPADTGDTAAPADPIRFVVIGDTGAGDIGQYLVAQALADVCDAEGCDFVLLVGDNIYPDGVTSTTDPLWTTVFEDPYVDVDAQFWAVMGNHDWGHTMDTAYLDAQVDYTSVSSKWYMPSDYYTRVEGDATFYGIDTWLIDNGEGLAQESWLPNERTNSTTSWNILFGHHPYVSNGIHGNASGDLETFFDSYVCGEYDVYFCGHDHNLQWLEPSCGTTFFVSGGGHSTYPITGTVNPAYFAEESMGFLWVEIVGDELTGVFYDQDGTELYRGTMTR